MTKSMKSLMTGAALAGLMTGSSAMAQRTTAAAKAFSSNTYLGHEVSFSDRDKHACKGQNSCKGKGGCATDGSKPPSA